MEKKKRGFTQFTPEERTAYSRLGGLAHSKEHMTRIGRLAHERSPRTREHMAAIGKLGGIASAAARKLEAK